MHKVIFLLVIAIATTAFAETVYIKRDWKYDGTETEDDVRRVLGEPIMIISKPERNYVVFEDGKYSDEKTIRIEWIYRVKKRNNADPPFLGMGFHKSTLDEKGFRLKSFRYCNSQLKVFDSKIVHRLILEEK